MSSKNYNTIKIATLVFTLLNTLAIAIGGYFLIGRSQGEMFQSTTKLNQIQAEMSKIQLSAAETNTRLDILVQNANITEKSIKLIDSVRPKFDFSIDSKVAYVNGRLTVTFNLVNHGEFELWVKPNRFLLSDEPYRNNVVPFENHRNYVLKTDYKEIDTVRGLGSKETRRHTFTVKIDPIAPKKIYYYMEYSVGTANEIVTLVDSMAQHLGVSNVKSISKGIVYRYDVIYL